MPLRQQTRGHDELEGFQNISSWAEVTPATGLRKVLALPRSAVFTSAFLLSIPAREGCCDTRRGSAVTDGLFVPEEN